MKETYEYASIIYNGGKLNERTMNIGLHRIVWNRKGLRTNLYRNWDDITMMRNIRNNQLSLGRTKHRTLNIGVFTNKTHRKGMPQTNSTY